MRMHRFAVLLTIVNIIVLIVLVSQLRVARAQQDVANVVRAHSIEIVDASGKVRAQLIVNPSTDAAGVATDGGVIFRMMDRDGKPLMKLGAADDGAGLMLSGDHGLREWNGIQVLAKPGGSSVRIVNKDGKERVVRPE